MGPSDKMRERRNVMEVLVIRHGQTASNATHTHSGWAPIPLSETGRKQATLVGKLLKDVSFDMVYSSDLERTRETTCLAGLDKRGVPVIYSPYLREIDVGSLEGKRVEDCECELGENYKQNRKKLDYRSYGGEDKTQLDERISSFMRLLEGQNGRRVAVVTSEGPIFSMMLYALHLDLPRSLMQLPNTAVVLLLWEDGVWKLKSWNMNAKPETEGRLSQ